MNIRTIRLLSEANIPIRYRYATLANYQEDKQNAAQLKEAKAYCQDILETEQDSILSHGFSACHENLIILGNVGIGKTRLAISILRRFIEQGIEGVFYRISELLRSIKDTFDNPDNGTSGTKLIDRCCQIPFLIIDDLGCCRHTPWVDEVLDDIFSERSADGLPTLITSNLSESQLNKYLGDRVHSRLIKGGRLLTFTGEDKRPKKLKDIPSPEEIALWQPIDKLNKKSESPINRKVTRILSAFTGFPWPMLLKGILHGKGLRLTMLIFKTRILMWSDVLTTNIAGCLANCLCPKALKGGGDDYAEADKTGGNHHA